MHVETNGIGNLVIDLKIAVERGEGIEEFCEHILAVAESIDTRRAAAEAKVQAAAQAMYALNEGLSEAYAALTKE